MNKELKDFATTLIDILETRRKIHFNNFMMAWEEDRREEASQNFIRENAVSDTIEAIRRTIEQIEPMKVK